MCHTCILVVTTVVVAACGRPRVESLNAEVDQLFADWNRTDSPGCAVGISRNGAVVYEHAYGMANLELSVPNTTDTVFAIASITKAFTAMSVLLAAQQGKLSLDDEVQKYIPDWLDREDHITIRHLLTHTSGIRDAFGLLGWADPSESAGDYNEAIARILARQRGVNFPPGSEYQYNNGGYNLLATILRRATGQSLGEFADANIFKPLGMAHTGVHSEPAILVPNRATGYTRDARGWRAAREGVGIGNGGMYSTVGDLLRWQENFENPRVGSSEMLAAMQQPTVLKDRRTTTVGISLGLGQYRSLPTVEASGGDYGIASKIAWFPRQHFAVALLCNEDSIVMGGRARVNPDVFTNGIADIYLADVLGIAPAASHASAKIVAPLTPLKLSEADLSEKTGLYRVVGRDLPVLMRVERGTLMFRSYYQDDVDFELTPVAPNKFTFQNMTPFEFVPAAPERTKAWRVGESNDPRVLQPVTLALSAAELRRYAGDYRSDELGVTYTIQPQGSALLVKATGRPEVMIAPFANDVFVGDWVGIVKFSRDVRGAITSFTINRDNARGVRFARPS